MPVYGRPLLAPLYNHRVFRAHQGSFRQVLEPALFSNVSAVCLAPGRTLDRRPVSIVMLVLGLPVRPPRARCHVSVVMLVLGLQSLVPPQLHFAVFVIPGLTHPLLGHHLYSNV